MAFLRAVAVSTLWLSEQMPRRESLSGLMNHEIKFSKSWLKTFLETSKKGQEKMTLLKNYENKYGATSIWNDAYVPDIGSSDGFQSAKPHRVMFDTQQNERKREWILYPAFTAAAEFCRRGEAAGHSFASGCTDGEGNV